MSALNLLPGTNDIADALRQLTGRSDPAGHLLAGIGLFAAGLVAGAALAALFAPRSGAELRHEIGERVGSLRSRIADKETGRAESSRPA